MLTKDFLSAIQAAVFAPYFHEEIRNQFQANVEKGTFAKEQQEYEQASALLCVGLTPEKRQALSEYEYISTLIREFSASFGFTAGIYCGFKQLFTLDREEDGGFFSHVVDEIATRPRMECHHENYANLQKRHELYTRIIESESEQTVDLMTIICCYWDQAAHSASLNGFYCGYRAALGITFTVTPFNHSLSAVSSKLLTMEHRLGYIKSFSEIENELERKQPQCNPA